MGEISRIVGEISQLPQPIGQTVAVWAASLVVGLGVNYGGSRILDQHEEAFGLDMRGADPIAFDEAVRRLEWNNPEKAKMAQKEISARGIDGAIVETATDKPAGEQAVRKHRGRVLPVVALGTGLALAAGSYFTHPKIERNVKGPSANTVFVVDSSLSMQATTDMNNGRTKVSRETAAVDGIETSRLSGNVAVIYYGAGDTSTDPDLAISLQPVVSVDIKNLPNPNPAVDEGGEDTLKAMKLGAGLLPSTVVKNVQGKKTTKLNGTEVVITDGAIDNSPASIQQEVQQLRQEGAHIDVIVAGTASGRYYANGATQATPAVYQPTIFGNVNKLAMAQDTQSITDTVNTVIESATITHQSEPWQAPYWVAGALILAGTVAASQRELRKLI